MTKLTAEALEAAIEQLYSELGGYCERLKSSRRSPEDQAVFAQLFTEDLRRVQSQALTPLVRLLQLSDPAARVQQFKYLLPRLSQASLEAAPVVGYPLLCELLGRFDFERWPANERRAVWDYLLLVLRALLEEFAERRAPPWGAYGYFRELCRATTEVQPALLSWEMADFVTSLLHLASFVNAWVEDQPLRERQAWGRTQIETLDRWVASFARPRLEQAAEYYGAEPYAAEFRAAATKVG